VKDATRRVPFLHETAAMFCQRVAAASTREEAELG